MLLLFIQLAPYIHAQEIMWHDISALDSLNKLEQRPVLIDIYTDWCYWCIVMDRRTYNQREVVHLIDSAFWAVRLNAETTENIFYGGKIWQNNGNFGKFHSLAYDLMQGEMYFPTTLFRDNKMKPLAKVPGYYKPQDFVFLLTYILGKKYEIQTFAEFLKSNEK